MPGADSAPEAPTAVRDYAGRMATLILHGGAGRIDDERREAYEAGLREALAAGWSLLAAGGTALDAVERAVAVMEANPEAFNAGVGSSPTRDGTVECDACLVDGRDGRAGAVAAVRTARSPIALARTVMERTPHVLMVGAGAEALVDDPIPNDALLTPRALDQLERWRARREQPTGSATVGAAALDDHGALAAATSTGGVLGQWPGRVGDAPIPGAGTYADRRVALSCTGRGEAFLRAVTGKAFAERLAHGAPLESSLQRALDEVRSMDGSGGLIVALADGRLGWAFDTSHLALAWRSDDEGDALVADDAGVRVLGEARA